MFIIILYILELTIVYIWWNLIIETAMPKKGIIKKIVSLLIPKKFFLKYNTVKNRFGKKQYLMKTLKILVGKYDFMYLLFLLSLGPILMNVFVIGNESIILKFIVSMSFLGILLKSLYAVTSDLKKALFEVNYNMENMNFSTVPDENKFTKFIQIYKWKTVLLLAFFLLLASILFFILEKSVDWFKKFDAPVQIFFFSLTIIYIWLTDSVIPRKKKRSNYQEKNKAVEVENSLYLESVKQSIHDMCDVMEIKDLVVGIEESEYKNAYAIVQKYETPRIIITNSLCEEIMTISSNIDEYLCYIKLVLSHELIHIRFKDPIKIVGRVKVSCVLYLVIMFFLMFFPLLLGDYFPRPLFFVSWQIFVALLFFIGTICDTRYWQQIAELRADKLGLKISDLSKERFKELWIHKLNILEKDSKETRGIDSKNILYRHHKRYIEKEAHPSWSCRLANINRESEWGVRSYIIHIFQIWSWRIRGKGWNGR